MEKVCLGDSLLSLLRPLLRIDSARFILLEGSRIDELEYNQSRIALQGSNTSSWSTNPSLVCQGAWETAIGFQSVLTESSEGEKKNCRQGTLFGYQGKMRSCRLPGASIWTASYVMLAQNPSAYHILGVGAKLRTRHK